MAKASEPAQLDEETVASLTTEPATAEELLCCLWRVG